MISRPPRPRSGRRVPADMPDDLAELPRLPDPGDACRPVHPAVDRPGDRPRGRTGSPRHRLGRVPRATGRGRAGSRSATGSSRRTGDRGSRPRSPPPCIDWAQREHGVTRFRASTAPDNVGSQAIIANLGFVQTGIADGRDRWPRTRLRPRPGAMMADARSPDGPTLRHPRRPRRCRARRADRRRRTADLPDLDLRAGRRRSAASRLRVRPLAEPHPRSARAGHRDARGRRRTGSRSPPARRPRRPSPSSSVRATRSSSATTSTAGRTATSSRSASPGPASPRPPSSTSRPGWTRSGRRCQSGRDLVWLETPTNPLLKVVDIAAVAATVDRRRAAEGGRRPLHRGRQHVRLAGDPAATDPGRGHRLPLGDQVPGRPLRHDPRSGGHLGRRHRRAPAVPAERDGRRARPAGLLPRPARPADAAPSGRTPPVERARVAEAAPRPRRRGVGQLPGLRWHGLVHAGGRAAGGPRRSARSRSPRAPTGSPSPSRSAAWSRSSRSRPR